MGFHGVRRNYPENRELSGIVPMEVFYQILVNKSLTGHYTINCAGFCVGSPKHVSNEL